MTEPSANERAFSQLVVVGASAGGIEALSAMVSRIPVASAKVNPA